MATTTMPAPPQRMVAKHKGKLLLIGAGLLALVFILLVAVVWPQWPFREADMKRRIEQTANASAQIGGFHQVFFPHPGCVIENVILTPNNPERPRIEIKTLTVHGLYWGLFGKPKHLQSLSFDGLRLQFPPKNANDKPKEPTKFELSNDTRFDEIYAKDSQVIFAADGSHPKPRVYDIYQLVLKDFAENAAIHFSSQLKIPQPVANVEVSGVLGPIASDLGSSPLSGKFTMKNANLATFSALFGTLAAGGEFSGKLAALQVNGNTDTPNFGLTNTGHSLPLHTDFSVLVNGTNGDLQLQPVQAVLGRSKIVARGQFMSTPDKAHTTMLDLSSNDARIQDLMQLFVDKKAPLAGATQFKMRVQLPPSDQEFEKRLQLQASFGIRQSKFTHFNTQQKVSELSESARGNPKDEDPPMIVTDLLGKVTLKNGVARFSELQCSVPGAETNLHGTFTLETHAIDLHGTLHTSVKLSQATTGFKAFLMKMVEAAKAKKRKDAIVPVKITGTYDKPEYGLDAPAEK